ncbi:MAG: hypothetical protein IJ264_00425 [Clostridia bacterium]|nr:hypothetical protein [Clostridia bacterium]
MVKTMLDKLNIPSPLEVTGKRVQTVGEWEKVRLLVAQMMQECEYGYIPAAPESISVNIIEDDPIRYCAGKAAYMELEIVCAVNGENFSFPVTYVYPKKGDKFKTFVHINFRPDVPDKYMPTEEIIDNGFACASFCYQNVTSDDGDFTNGLAGVIYKNSPRTQYSPGKIAMWAWAAMRVMDFLQTRDEVDKDNICVCGHSRLGKTALLTAAIDERFAAAHSNCSGCSGDSLNRGKKEGNETIGDIIDRFEYWFCENYKNFYGKDDETPFEQHFLSALIAPRRLHIASAKEDVWAGPNLEFLVCAASSEVYELYGKTGFVYEDEDFLKAGKYLNDGNVGLCFREGRHYFSRDDWHGLFDFMNK